MHLRVKILVRFEGCSTPTNALSTGVFWQGLLPVSEVDTELFQRLQVTDQHRQYTRRAPNPECKRKIPPHPNQNALANSHQESNTDDYCV